MSAADLLAWIEGHRAILARTLGEHLLLASVALGAAILLGLAGGLALQRRVRATGPVMAAVTALRAVPSLALLVVLLPLLGTGFLPSVTALALYALPAVLINTQAGLSGVDAIVVDAARGQGLSERQVLVAVALPLALPVIFAGIRSAAVQIVSAATLAVFIGGGGLGELISAGMSLFDIPQLVVGALAVAALAILTELVFGGIERLIGRLSGTSAA